METEAPEETRKHILVVDDNEDMRILLEQMLEDEGIYDLSFAETGPRALSQAITLQPDLILMDMSLPEMSGWEVVSRIRQHAELAQTPILALTAHASRADQERALAVGCTAHLSKPFEVLHALQVIAGLLEP